MHHGLKDQLFYFRTNLGLEVDLMMESLVGNTLRLIEVKSTETARVAMFQSLEKVRELEERNQKRRKQIKNFLVYRGETIPKFREGGACLNYLDCFDEEKGLFG